jgi:hypothetical protein
MRRVLNGWRCVIGGVVVSIIGFPVPAAPASQDPQPPGLLAAGKTAAIALASTHIRSAPRRVQSQNDQGGSSSHTPFFKTKKGFATLLAIGAAAGYGSRDLHFKREHEKEHGGERDKD